MTKREEWLALAERCEKATGSDRAIDARLAVAAGIVKMSLRDNGWAFFEAPFGKGNWAFMSGVKCCESEAFAELGTCRSTPEFTSSLDHITSLGERLLPGWMCRVQWCSVSAEAWWAPDLNDPLCPADIRADGARWHDYSERNEVELRPGSRQSGILALCAAFCRAKAEVCDA